MGTSCGFVVLTALVITSRTIHSKARAPATEQNQLVQTNREKIRWGASEREGLRLISYLKSRSWFAAFGVLAHRPPPVPPRAGAGRTKGTGFFLFFTCTKSKSIREVVRSISTARIGENDIRREISQRSKPIQN
jgi:hypothetical protein